MWLDNGDYHYDICLVEHVGSRHSLGVFLFIFCHGDEYRNLPLFPMQLSIINLKFCCDSVPARKTAKTPVIRVCMVVVCNTPRHARAIDKTYNMYSITHPKINQTQVLENV